jgi:hypothetical protein
MACRQGSQRGRCGDVHVHGSEYEHVLSSAKSETEEAIGVPSK